MQSQKKLNPHQNMWANLSEVERLLEIHTQLAGNKPGYKHDVEVLNKSAIILLVACWEAFIEDLAEAAFDLLTEKASSHNIIDNKVLAHISREIKKSDNDLYLWKLAGSGWKNVLSSYKKDIFDRYAGKLNTPKPDQINEIYKCLFGIKSMSDFWHWAGMKSDQAFKKLNKLVTLRGAISHKVKVDIKIHKDLVNDYNDFVNRIAIATSNAMRQYIIEKLGISPWSSYAYNSDPSITHRSSKKILVLKEIKST